MSTVKPVALSIAGFDPSGGAGVLADIKTFEQFRVYGFGVITADTVQDEKQVYDVTWKSSDHICQQIEPLLKAHHVPVAKIGIVENDMVFATIKDCLTAYNPDIHIVWDPILRSTSGYPFFQGTTAVKELLDKVYLVTPNWPEFEQLFKSEAEVLSLSKYCNIYLKGGHRQDKPGTDLLYSDQKKYLFKAAGKNAVYDKHGSGCVLSSAITAALAQGHGLQDACQAGKKYTTRFLSSDTSLLGWHNTIKTV